MATTNTSASKTTSVRASRLNKSGNNTSTTSDTKKSSKEKEPVVAAAAAAAADEDVDSAAADDSSDVDSDSSDEYPTEEKDRFVAQLYKFMDDRGTPMNKVPAVNKVDLDLHKFFVVVRKNGGYNKVSKQRKWSDVYKKLALPDMNSANVSNLKSAYER